MRWNGLIDKYKEWLPVTENTPMLTLHEGNTPLIHLAHLSERWGIDLYVKVEVQTRQVHLKIEEWLWRLRKRKKKVNRSLFVHQLAIRLHQQRPMAHVQVCGRLL